MKQRYIFEVTYNQIFRSGKTFTHRNRQVAAVTERGAIKSLEWMHNSPIEIKTILQKESVGKPFAYESNDIGDT